MTNQADKRGIRPFRPDPFKPMISTGGFDFRLLLRSAFTHALRLLVCSKSERDKECSDLSRHTRVSRVDHLRRGVPSRSGFSRRASRLHVVPCWSRCPAAHSRCASSRTAVIDRRYSNISEEKTETLTTFAQEQNSTIRPQKYGQDPRKHKDQDTSEDGNSREAETRKYNCC